MGALRRGALSRGSALAAVCVVALAFFADRATAAVAAQEAGRGCEPPGNGNCAADAVTRWRPLIAGASRRFGVPERWIERVIRAESGGRTSLGGRPIRSPKGAIGLMQLMPGTWAEMRRRLRLGDDPDHPRDNILAGTLYLRMMYDRFGYPGLFGAYNAGPARYADWLAGRARLPQETLAYLGKVGVAAPDARAAGVALAERQDAPAPALFAVLRVAQAAGSVARPVVEREDSGGDATARTLGSGERVSAPAADIATSDPGAARSPQAGLFAIRKGRE